MELGNWCCTSNNCVYHSKALGLVNRYRKQKGKCESTKRSESMTSSSRCICDRVTPSVGEGKVSERCLKN